MKPKCRFERSVRRLQVSGAVPLAGSRGGTLVGILGAEIFEKQAPQNAFEGIRNVRNSMNCGMQYQRPAKHHSIRVPMRVQGFLQSANVLKFYRSYSQKNIYLARAQRTVRVSLPQPTGKSFWILHVNKPQKQFGIISVHFQRQFSNCSKFKMFHIFIFH